VPTEKKLRVVVDPGHGAPGNSGNRGLDCQMEADFTLSAGRALAEALTATGRYEVRVSRDGNLPGYDERMAAAVSWKADVIVSLHSDARGEPVLLRMTADGGQCARNDVEPGTAVLYSQEGDLALVGSRHRLCRAFAHALEAARFPVYSGINYAALYTVDAEERGCWLDTHQPGKRIYFLRKTSVPTVIIETHHALDRSEVDQWKLPATHQAFAAAVSAGLDAWRASTADAGR
jgi:N-acetylmuramoyl-L-alanine amidase